MWFLRRILNISWAERHLMRSIEKSWGLKVPSHSEKKTTVICWPYYRKDDLERLALTVTGRVQGKRDWGRQRVIRFLNSLNQGVTQGNRSKTEFLRLADDREEWRLMTADVCNRPGT
ncbi:hypothetical protein ElyMa_005102400 [Elysia marginata]|uniref:Uncharacterized protein n=1 Tax=Elysia marginata TaxID=1093978 RepID=A0AAV4JJZ0_9GAST|nr:hypothetical protein ElyMa_005102400 [Elysia marginata]